MRRSISRPCSALPMRSMTYSPQYGVGRGRRTVACMSLVSRAGERVETVSPTGFSMENMRASLSWGPGPFRTGPPTIAERRLSNLVEEFFSRLADALQPSNVPHRQIRMGDVPVFCRDLVLSDPVFHRRVAKPRKLLEFGEQHIQLVGNLRCKLVEIGVPRIAIVGGGEEQFRVIVQEHKTLIVDGGYLLRAEVGSHHLQQGAKSLRSARHELKDQGQLRDLTLTK